MKSTLVKHILEVILVTLILVLVALSVLLVREYRHARLLTGGYSWRHVRRLRTIQDTQNIQPWMTFDYVNRVFGLPNSYLQTTFNITDQSYPRLAIGAYALKLGNTPQAFSSTVAAAVAHYISDHQ